MNGFCLFFSNFAMILTQQAIGIPHFHFNIFQNLWCYVLFFITLHPYNTYSTWRIDTLTVIGQSWMFIVLQGLVCVSQLSSIFNHRKNIKRCHRLYIHWFRFINHCLCFIIHCRRFNFCPALRRLLMAPFSCFRRGISDWKNVKNVKPCNVERELPYIKVYGAARDRPANH